MNNRKENVMYQKLTITKTVAIELRQMVQVMGVYKGQLQSCYEE
ncbi:hypothetical protein [Streptococcus oralis]|nr:hypothetical protein [Streptococcus oralis]AQA07721.1 hypothetical protein BWR56_1139 [Streptococcus oralis]